MIEIKNKKDCCGCHACVSVCAKHCITMQTDSEGFLYPVVDKDSCTDCGLCEKVCPVIHQAAPVEPQATYIAINRDEEIRLQSSSGGIFTLLAEQVIAEGGVVFGARFDADWSVIHAWTDTVEGLAVFRGSKYVQSRIGNTYREARAFLQQGRKVLFSGTPCQIAGLKKYLRKEYDNLLTVDFICHGVPSPGVWQRYLSELREELRAERGVGKNTVPLSMDELPVITGISFRDKTNGWKKFGFLLCYAASEAASNSVSSSAIKEEKEFLQPFPENPFMQGFLADVYLRPSCYACPAKSGKSGSDITIADAWGMDCFAVEHDDDKGACYVLENTAKGTSYMSLFSFEQRIVDINVIKQYNLVYVSSVKLHPKRLQFFKQYKKDKVKPSVKDIVLQLLTPTYSDKLLWSINRRLTSIKNLLQK